MTEEKENELFQIHATEPSFYESLEELKRHIIDAFAGHTRI